jgi:MFS family permease
VAVLVAVVRETPRPEPSAGGYRHVLRDGAFLRLAAANLAVIAVGWGAFSWLLPPFAHNSIGLATGPIGLLLAANAVTVVLVQVPVARLAEGRRRMRMMALAAGVFTVASVAVIAAGTVAPGPAYALLLAVCVAVGAGECFYTATLMPLTAELAPDGLRGRYLAALGFSWWAGLAIAPALGGPLLSRSPAAVFAVAAAASAAAGVALLRLEPRLPAAARRTPHPAGHGDLARTGS